MGVPWVRGVQGQGPNEDLPKHNGRAVKYRLCVHVCDWCRQYVPLRLVVPAAGWKPVVSRESLVGRPQWLGVMVITLLAVSVILLQGMYCGRL